jgi:GNAT superfamily N-acetyltransferase
MRHDTWEQRAVQGLFAECHPGWPAHPNEWYVAHATLVLFEAGALRGVTSFSVGPCAAALGLYGADVLVHPSSRGRGYGLRLHRERFRYGRAVPCQRFVGATQPDNLPMIAIFERTGAKPTDVLQKFYPDESDAVIYTGPVEE